jgi:hypothetical protein
VLSILSLAEEMNCTRLRRHCLRWLRETYGAWQRRSGEGAPPSPQLAGSAPEVACAAAVASLSGFDALSAALKDDVAWHVGLPARAFHATVAEMSDAAAAAATSTPGALRVAHAVAGEDVGTSALTEGDAVAIVGMRARTDLNGKLGTLLSYHEEKSRWACRMDDDGERVMIRPANVIRLSSLEAPVVAWWEQGEQAVG